MNKLEKGEIVCPECNGNSWTHKYVKEKDVTYTAFCRHCKGEGKIDWVDNLTVNNNNNKEIEIETYTIKNVLPFKTIHLGRNLKIKPNSYMYYSFSKFEKNSTNVFDLIDICKYMKEGSIVLYENPPVASECSQFSKYSKMLQIVMYGEVVIK